MNNSLSIHINYIWDGKPTLKKNNDLLNGFIEGLNKRRDDLYFSILVPPITRIKNQLKPFKNVQYCDMITNPYSDKDDDKWVKEYNEGLDYLLDFNVLNWKKPNHIELSNPKIHIKKALTLGYPKEEAEKLVKNIPPFLNPLHPKFDKKQRAFYWNKVDCDLIINFAPMVQTQLINHWYNTTNNSPHLWQIYEKKMVDTIVDRMKGWEYFLGTKNVHSSLNLFENDETTLKIISATLKTSTMRIGAMRLNFGFVYDDLLNDRTLDFLNDRLDTHIEAIIGNAMKKPSPAYKKMKKFIQKNRIVSKFELIRHMNWGRSRKFDRYRNRLRKDSFVRLVGNDTFEWVSRDKQS